MIFRTLPPFGGDARAVAEIVRNIMDGKTNNTGTVTLNTGNATTTTITDARIGVESKIILVPYSAAAYADAVPYGSFYDLTDQSAASTTTAYAITFSNTDLSNNVYLSNSSRINVRAAGKYNFQFSIQFANDDSQIQDVDVWIRKNGTDVADSNSKFSIDSKHGSIKGHVIAALNLFVDLAANDYIELMWATTSTLAIIEHIPTQTSPTRPATPSVIATMQFVGGFSNGGVYISSVTNGSATITHFPNATSDKTYGYVVVG
jgi:hypothetical protein